MFSYIRKCFRTRTKPKRPRPRVSLLLSLLCQFLISIVVERPDGREIAKPVELRVMVGDANDNRPTFPQAQYHTVVKELAARGNRWLSFSNVGLNTFL